MNRVSLFRLVAATIATSALCWLIVAVNAHGDDVQRGAVLLLIQPPSIPLAVPSERTGGGGLELVDMYQCMCASNGDVSLWVKWWLIAAVFGGIPIATLIRGYRESSLEPRPNVSHPVA
jgi:hypothetical protein